MNWLSACSSQWRRTCSTVMNAMLCISCLQVGIDLLRLVTVFVNAPIRRASDSRCFLGSFPELFPAPQSREFIFYAERPQPTPACRPVPQRMYAMLKDNELRVVEMTSIDTKYS